MHHATPPPKCGKCHSANIESVGYYNRSFLRCRNCGHEGPKSVINQELEPQPKHQIAKYVRSMDELFKQRTF